MEPTAFALAELPFLKGMDWRHLELMSSCAMTVRFAAGEHVFRTGDPANRFFILLSGKVSLEAASEQGVRVPFEVISAGDVLGWSWLFPPYFWRFDAVTLEPVEAVFFYGTRLRDAADQDAALCCDLMKRMTKVILQRLQATRTELVKSQAGV